MMFLVIKKMIPLALIACFLLSSVGCTTTSYKDSNSIIEAEMLTDILAKENTVVIDARSPEEYDKGHLINAINLPPTLLTISEPVAGLIAPKETVEEVLGSLGISNQSDVYIYDNNGGVNAARVWWVLRIYGHENVRVINKGEVGIIEEKLQLTREVPKVKTVEYSATELDTSMIATIEEVEAVINGTSEACILDVRSQAEFDEGAIPTALLYPHTKNLYSDNSFKSERDIYLNYNDLGLERDELVIVYCKTSFRATQTALLLGEAGFTKVKVYDGAWSEWSLKDMPAEEKTEEKVTPSAQDGS